MESKTAINFLLYSLAGVTLESDKKTIVERASKRAFRDASSHVLSIKEDMKEELIDEGITTLRDSIIEGLGDSGKDENYDKWHGKLCTELKNIYKDKTADERKFTYGIAQKWVNMTMKYLTVFYCVFIQENPVSDFCQFYRVIAERYEKYFHAPVDRNILKEVKKEIRGEKEYLKTKNSAWSKWDADEEEWKNEKDIYHIFEGELKELIKEKESLLEWEMTAWISAQETEK